MKKHIQNPNLHKNVNTDGIGMKVAIYFYIYIYIHISRVFKCFQVHAENCTKCLQHLHTLTNLNNTMLVFFTKYQKLYK